MARLQRPAILVLALALTGAACTSEPERAPPTEVSVLPDGDLYHFDLRGVAADPTGGGWLLQRVADGSVVHHLDRSATLAPVAELPAWERVEIIGVEDGRLAAVGIRCESVESCESAVSEVVWVSPDGEVSDAARLSSREGWDREEDGGSGILGTSDGLVWVRDFGGREVLAVDDEGRVEARSRADGGTCLVDGDLYGLEESNRLGSWDERPDHLMNYFVSTVVGGAVVTVDGSRTKAPPDTTADCIPSGFEVYRSTEPEALLWTPADGWSPVQRALDPVGFISTHAPGLRGDQMIVDATGSLLARNAARTWEATGITFEATRSNSTPPLVLRADKAGDAVVACIQAGPDQQAFECRAA